LDGNHKRRRQKYRPEQTVAELRSSLWYVAMPDGSSSAAPVTSPGPNNRNNMLRGFLEIG
jgi:hypothetical protein